jgi:hypothetical protein
MAMHVQKFTLFHRATPTDLDVGLQLADDEDMFKEIREWKPARQIQCVLLDLNAYSEIYLLSNRIARDWMSLSCFSRQGGQTAFSFRPKWFLSMSRGLGSNGFAIRFVLVHWWQRHQLEALQIRWLNGKKQLRRA